MGTRRRSRRTLSGLAILLALVATMLAATALGSSSRAIGVSAEDNFFDPKKVKIGQGQKVVWTNSGSNDHTVKFKGKKNKIIAAGETTSKKFKKNGVFRYVCTIHKAEGMKGKVVAGDG